MAGVAILIGLAMMGGMMIMIKSFRATVQIWIDQTISADLFVIPAAREVSGLEAKMPKQVLDMLKALPGTLALDPIQIHQTTLNGEEVTLSARDFSILRDYSSLLVIGGHAEEAIQQSLEQEAVLVSEPLAYRLKIQKGHRIQLPSPKGPVTFTVAGVFYDYTTDGGRVLMDGGLFGKYWPEDKITTLAVYLEPETDPETARQAILRQLGKDHRILITSNKELRDRILKIFDQTFAITYALEIIAVLVAILGVMNTLLTSIMERKRELAIVRVLGSTQTQMQKIILYEGFLISLIGISLGLAASLLLSQILIHAINKQSYGWTIFLHPSWIGLFQAAVLVLLASLLSAYLPAKQASSIQLTEALQYE
jgi:putative ABC transport system permease protein